MSNYSKRYDVCSPRARKDSEKPYWHRVGTAFEGDKGISIIFDSLPLPDKEGRVSVFLFEPREKEDAPKAKTNVRQSSADMGRGDPRDEIPN